MPNESYQKLLDYSLKLLSIRPRSTWEIRSKLVAYTKKRKLSQDCIEKSISYLSEKNLLNDRDFSIWWISQRSSFRPKGWRVIREELRMKGVDREVIDALTPDKSSEYTSAKKVAQKKLRFISRLPDSEAKLRIKEALLRRGFSWDTISRVIDEME